MSAFFGLVLSTPVRELKGRIREMKNIRRAPTFGDFVTIRTERSMQDVTVARIQSTRVQTPLSSLFKCDVLRESLSLWTVKIFLAQH
jgi:hypothetical protein